MKNFYKTLYLERNWKIIPIDFYKSTIISYLHHRFTQIEFNSKLNKDWYIILWRDVAYSREHYIERALKYRQQDIEQLESMWYSELLKKYFNI